MKHRITSVSTMLALALGCAALGSGAPAHAETPPPVEERYHVSAVHPLQNPNEEIVIALALYLEDQEGNPPTHGTKVHAAIYSCGRFLQEAENTIEGRSKGVSVWLSPDGEPDLAENSVSRLVGPTVEHVVTVTQVGYDPYTLDRRSYGGYGVRRPSCSQIDVDAAHPPCVVSRQSVKKKTAAGRRAVVGRPVGVTPTRASCPVRYRWRVNGKVVDRDRSFTPTRAHRGERLVMLISVGRPGGTSTRQSLGYGKVGRR